jgi:hypothetical protein
MESPYKPGATLQLQLPDRINLFVKIERVFEPFTMAVVLRVSFQSELQPDLACIRGMSQYSNYTTNDLRKTCVSVTEHRHTPLRSRLIMSTT